MKRNLLLMAATLAIVLFLCPTVFAKASLLREGARGKEVREVQEMLIKLEYLKGKPSGIFDKETVQAVRRFQRDRAIEVDGIVGPQTRAELRKKDLKKASEAARETEKRGAAAREASERKAANDKEALDYAVKHGKLIHVFATAYSAHDPGCGAYTASGTPVRHGIIAVDPSFIPLGTRVYIPGYGEAIAEDTGGAIIGDIIDLAFDTYDEVIAFGRRELDIYILDYPK